MNNGVKILENIIDLDIYPIHDLTHPHCQSLIDYCHTELNNDGCCLIPDFFKLSAISKMARHANDITDHVYQAKDMLTAYGDEADLNLPEDHPRRFQYKRGGGFVDGNLLNKDSILRQFFDSLIVKDFMMRAFDIDPFKQKTSSIIGTAINCMWQGDEFPWHFDRSDLTVSILLQAPDSGGVFEYVPNIRTPDNENYDQIRKIFSGDREGVRSIQLRSGDMQLFKGRYTLHRVTEVMCKKPRLVALYFA